MPAGEIPGQPGSRPGSPGLSPGICCRTYRPGGSGCRMPGRRYREPGLLRVPVPKVPEPRGDGMPAGRIPGQPGSRPGSPGLSPGICCRTYRPGGSGCRMPGRRYREPGLLRVPVPKVPEPRGDGMPAGRIPGQPRSRPGSPGLSPGICCRIYRPGGSGCRMHGRQDPDTGAAAGAGGT